MNVIEVFRQAFDSRKASRTRSALTVLVISEEFLAVISANADVLILDTYFKDTMSLMGGDVITVSKFPTIQMGPSDWQKYRNRQDITIAQMERLQDMTGGGSGIGPNRTYRTTRVSFKIRRRNPTSA